MGPRERRERQREALRGRILDAAGEIMVAKGLGAVTMRAIADRIEYSPTTIYLHFSGREALLRGLCDRALAALAEQFAGIERIADPIEKLRRAARLYLQFGVEHPNAYRAVFMTPETAGSGQEAWAFLRAIAAAGLEQGLFRRELRDAESVAQTVWAGVHGVIALEIAKGNEPWIAWRPFETRAALMVDALIEGLAM